LNDHEIAVLGAYDFGPVRIGLVYEYKKWDVAAGGDINNNMYGISGTIPAGPGKIFAYWGEVSNGKGSAVDGQTLGVASGPVKGPDTSAQQWEVSYTYPLSKRTQVYAGYVKYNNKNNATYTFNINPYAVAPGGDPQGLVMGMIHFF
ncbi:MAG: porin, partial [Casimicrobiaceae bacterium]